MTFRSDQENKQIYDDFYSHKAEIEKEFGEALKWERIDNRRASRISREFDYAGLSDKEQWEKLQDDMIDAMIRLEKVLGKHIKSLKI